jgi:hypothetical protein
MWRWLRGLCYSTCSIDNCLTREDTGIGDFFATTGPRGLDRAKPTVPGPHQIKQYLSFAFPRCGASRVPPNAHARLAHPFLQRPSPFTRQCQIATGQPPSVPPGHSGAFLFFFFYGSFGVVVSTNVSQS